MWFFKFILSLLHVFYVGILIVICLILGFLNPFFFTVAKILFTAWILYGIVDQIILAKVMRDSPELQEIVNATIANTVPNGRRIPEGEVTLCELKSSDMQLVGRCLNSVEEHWSIRLLYEGSYQIFDWKLVYNSDFLPQMVEVQEGQAPKGSLWVKCYETNEDGVARWNLHLLRRKREVFEDVKLDYSALIDVVSESFDMTYRKEEKVIVIETKESVEDICEKHIITISNSGFGVPPVSIEYGRMCMIDLEECKFYLSVGPRYEEFGTGEIAGYYVTGTYYDANGKLNWKNLCIENVSGK